MLSFARMCRIHKNQLVQCDIANICLNDISIFQSPTAHVEITCWIRNYTCQCRLPASAGFICNVMNVCKKCFRDAWFVAKQVTLFLFNFQNCRQKVASVFDEINLGRFAARLPPESRRTAPHLQHNWVKASLKAIYYLKANQSGLRADFLDSERNSSDSERDLERILNFLAARAVSAVLSWLWRAGQWVMSSQRATGSQWHDVMRDVMGGIMRVICALISCCHSVGAWLWPLLSSSSPRVSVGFALSWST